MLDRLLNNRKEWNALKEVHEAKMAALEEARKAREEEAEKAAAARQGRDAGAQDQNLSGWEIVTSSAFSFPPSCSERCSVPVEDVCCELETQHQDQPS